MIDRHTGLPVKHMISLGRVELVFVGVALATGLYTLARPAHTSAQTRALPFESVQTDLFSVPNSYSNAWADFDNDGDLDLAVSLKSGEIRLYRNDGGVLVSVGGAMGLPTAGGEFRALSWGDYDGDGWIDLLAGSSLPDKPSAV